MIVVQLVPSLGTGFYEELAFRGYVLQTMGERTQLWIAVGVSCLLFSAVHFFGGSVLPWNIAGSIGCLG
jgi:membrane protease YdiL (CAAX protease family)